MKFDGWSLSLVINSTHWMCLHIRRSNRYWQWYLRHPLQIERGWIADKPPANKYYYPNRTDETEIKGFLWKGEGSRIYFEIAIPDDIAAELQANNYGPFVGGSGIWSGGQNILVFVTKVRDPRE